jgi:phenylalanyl-tRNA synthetase alpha chain
MIHTLLNQLKALQDTQSDLIGQITTLSQLDQIKIDTLGKKGALTQILQNLGTLTPEERPKLGQEGNLVKTHLQGLIDEKRRILEHSELEAKLSQDTTDITLPGRRPRLGHLHPINQTLNDIIAIFERLGFSLKEGPDIETDYYNFEALNIPEHHPARDMHDTFYMQSGHVLRTHTSGVQIHVLEHEAPPLKIIVPGKVYRFDSDTTHSPCFHQIEGLYVNQNVSFAELKETLTQFLHAIFGQKRPVRFRPSYFPFTEPSTEVDVQCFQCKGKGCGLCKQTGWLEILGAGMVNRNVLRHVKLDPDKITGFAFGLGIERIAMLRYEIQDIRLFYENDQRFLEQF